MISRLCSWPVLAASEDDGDHDQEDEEALYEDEAVEGADIDSEEAYANYSDDGELDVPLSKMAVMAGNL